MNKPTNKKGFTLIEVVLVLAIAGLIMVIVFLAVAGAQRARRDTQRKSDAGKIETAFEQYASNNNGAYPNSWTAGTPQFWTTYVTPLNLTDPTSGAAYTQGTFTVGATPVACGAAGTVEAAVNGRQVTVRMCLESGFQDVKNF